MSVSLAAIRPCLEGGVPAMIATCARDGTPNVAYVSHVHMVDAEHVALSFQFFNKTRQNILENPQATVLVMHPRTLARYRLHLVYERTETAGPLFESMKARLAGIASHTGMSGVFRLLGSDIYRVRRIETVAAGAPVDEPSEDSPLGGARRAVKRLSDASDIDDLTERMLDAVQLDLRIGHAMLLLCDSDMTRLYTVASRGYPASGVGSEIPMGAGIIGVAAQYRVPIRINHSAKDYGYGRAVRESVIADGMRHALETEIPFPGLADPHSQLAVPVRSAGELLGVLYVECEHDAAFGHEHEDTLASIGDLYGLLVRSLQNSPEADELQESATPAGVGFDEAPLTVRRYPRDNSIFLGDDYLIKGVAGAILWKLLGDYLLHQRVEFSNRELRCDPAIRLPDIVDNLEARLILLNKRLDERCEFIRMEKTGRGRFRLRVNRRLSLVEVTA